MGSDLSALIREEYLGRCEALASSLARPGSRGINGVEFDDLVQEGLIDVWQSLSRGITPSDQIIRRRMVSYMRWLGRQGVEYGTMLPLDDYAEAVSRAEITRTVYTGEEDDGQDPLHGEVQGD